MRHPYARQGPQPLEPIKDDLAPLVRRDVERTASFIAIIGLFAFIALILTGLVRVFAG